VVYGQSVNRSLSSSLIKYATVLQAQVYAIIACADEIETQDPPEKYVSIYSDGQGALKALQAAKITSPLVRQCQQALNGISTRHAFGLNWVPGNVGLIGNQIDANSQVAVVFSGLLVLSPTWGSLGSI
jgi:hypothetical protein